MSVEEQVLGLEIAIDDVLSMQVLEGQSHLSGVELGYGIGESLLRVSTKSPYHRWADIGQATPADILSSY